MKNLTVMTIITLMLIFVLPMAKAQEKSPTEGHASNTQNTEEFVSHVQINNDSEAKLRENEKQLSEQMQALEAQLKKLEVEKQNLQKERETLEKARLEVDKIRDLSSQAAEKTKAAKDKTIKESAEAKKWKQWAEQWQNNDEFRQWQQQMQHWQNSDEFKQWQNQMQQWHSQMQQWQHKIEQEAQKHQESAGAGEQPIQPAPHPVPQMPHMPPMPPLPSMPPMPETPPLPESVPSVNVAPRVTVPRIEMPEVVIPNVNVQAMEVPVEVTVPVVAQPSSSRVGQPVQPDINVKKDENGKFVATREMEFVTKIEPGASLVVQNKVGKIALNPGKDRNCTVKAVIRATADTAEKAQEMIEHVAMNNQSSSERFFLQPVKSGDDDWSNLNVDLLIAAPSSVSVDVSTDVGSIEITNLNGKIKGLTNVGAIKAVNIVGEIKLTTRVGDIEFAAPRDLSAKLQANTKVGSIESEFPLDINKVDIIASTAKGAIGSGEGDICLTTEVGKIRIKKPSSPEN